MKPDFKLLDSELVNRILDEAFQLLRETGVKVQLPEARQLLVAAGADVDETTEVVKLSEKIIREAVATVPSEFFLYTRDGKPSVRYGGDTVHFDPGSSRIRLTSSESSNLKSGFI